MEDSSKTSRVGIEGIFYSLAHVPELVRFGSKPGRGIAAHSGFDEKLASRAAFFCRCRGLRAASGFHRQSDMFFVCRNVLNAGA